MIQKDVNAEAYDKLLTKSHLERMFNGISKILVELDGKQSLSYKEQKEYSQLGNVSLSAPYVIRNIEEGKRILRDKEEFYDPTKYNWGLRMVSQGLALVSAAYYPTTLSLHDFKMRYSRYSTKQIARAIQDKNENPFLDYFNNITVPEIIQEKPDIVGISIANSCQVIPGLTLASLIKDAGFYVTIGGTIITKLVEKIRDNRALFTFADSFIAYEGEHALLALAQQLQVKGDFRKVPNLIYSIKESIYVNEPFLVEDVNSLPTPDFDGLPFELYLSPEKVLPLSLSKGCYWSNCAFCDIYYSNIGGDHPNHYRPRRTDLVMEDILQLSRRYNTKFFIFTDESLSPKAMSALSHSLITNNLDVQWLCYARFENALTPELCRLIARAGCRKLLLGLESGSQRVLDVMKKGISTEIIETTLKNLYNARVSFYLFCLIGFPTETEDEVLKTMSLLIQNKEVINTPGSFFEVVQFEFADHCTVAQSPDTYGVTQIFRNPDDDLATSASGFHAKSGMNSLETAKALSNILNQLDREFSSERFPTPEEYNILYHSHYDNKPFPYSFSYKETEQNNEYSFQAKLFIPKSVSIISFRYDLEYITNIIYTIDRNIQITCLEKSWLAEEEIRSDVESNVAALYPEETFAVTNVETNTTVFIDNRGKFFLDLCDGNHNLNNIAQRYSKDSGLTLEESSGQCMEFFKHLLAYQMVTVLK
ncbi:B12-binding domain-containing radical SAM protein [Chloroflexota bacterium]